MGIVVGLILVIVSGLGTGTAGWPMKVIKDIHFEPYVFVKVICGVLIYPWLVVLINVPDLNLLIKTVGFKTLLVPNLLTLGWGIANLLYIIGVIRIGAALTGAILSSIGMSVGVLMPLVLKGSGLFSNAPDLLSKPGLVVMIGLIVMILGVVGVSIAGFGREKALENESIEVKKEQASGNFLQGLILVIIGGILSCGLSLAFVYSQGPIMDAVKLQGVSEVTANITVWALVCVGGALIQLAYVAYSMTKEKSWNLLFIRKDEIICGALIGLQLIISFALMGRGMILLGILGASIGFGIQQSTQIIGNQIVGFVSREWKGVKGRPRNTMYLALVVILIAIIIFAFSRTIT